MKMINNKYLEEFNIFKSNGIFFSTKEYFLISKYNKVYLYDRSTRSFNYKGSVKITLIDNIFKYFRLYQRLRRLIFYNIIPIGNNRYFLNYSNKVGYIDDKGKYYPLKNKNRKFKILNNGLSEDEYFIYFGEYIANNKRTNEINIYRFSKNNLENEIIYTFKAGLIRHIHGIYRDPFSSYFYVLTGDLPNECNIYVSKDNFKSVKRIGGGDETWRAVSLVFTEKLIYYGTDSEYIQNHVFTIDKENYSRKKIGNLSGPVYYSVLHKKKPIFFITAEMCPSQSDDYFKIIEYKDGKLKTRCKLLKDYRYPKIARKFLSRVFMPGNMHLTFHNDKNMDEIFVYGIGLNGYDDKVYKLN